MNRYRATFERLRGEGRTALIPFAVAGDPGCAASEAVFKTYVDAGADILEIGYPFSDPIADGPVNQRAAGRAIGAGLDHRRFFRLVRSLRAYTDMPFGLLAYANSVHHYGYRRFCDEAVEAGIDSLLVADLPPEEADEALAAMNRARLGSVFIVSELTPADRMTYICAKTTAFVYVVSRLGPTGAAGAVGSAVGATLGRLRKATGLPLCVGFGLSTPAHVRAVRAAGASGAIVGSALVSLIEQHRARPRLMLRHLYRRVGLLKKAT